MIDMRTGQINYKGFTLVELMVVVVIVGILAAVSVPVYTSYTKKARASEGQALVGVVSAAEKAYFAEHNICKTVTLANGGDPANDPFGINASQNSFFSSYAVAINATTGNCAFTVTTAGFGAAQGTSVRLIQPAAGPAVITVTW
jgi:prepilin-type N-terminal cleavage/methylation domain-containing protein